MQAEDVQAESGRGERERRTAAEHGHHPAGGAGGGVMPEGQFSKITFPARRGKKIIHNGLCEHAQPISAFEANVQGKLAAFKGAA